MIAVTYLGTGTVYGIITLPFTAVVICLCHFQGIFLAQKHTKTTPGGTLSDQFYIEEKG
jgi:ethanolamine transporter EutH